MCVSLLFFKRVLAFRRSADGREEELKHANEK